VILAARLNSLPTLTGHVQDWLEFPFGWPFIPIQIRGEIITLMEQVAARQPWAVLKIGTEGGGTLLQVTLAAPHEAAVISVALPTLYRNGSGQRIKLSKR
jgi:hypothetical protein